MSKLQRYSSYKESGVEWLGEIPENWEIIKLKFLLKEKVSDGPHETPPFIEIGIPFLSVDGIQDGELTFDKCRYVSEQDHNNYSKKANVTKGSILMGKAASTGKIAQVKVDFPFSIWSPLALIKPNNLISSSILEYYLKSHYSQIQIDWLCNINTQKNIGMGDIPKILVVLPPIKEQTTIASFLDEKTAQIDQAIRQKEQLIELLKERRQIVINEAVTKGLNPNASMKESGVEWIGEIPEHWEVKKLKYAVKKIGDIDHYMPNTVTFGKPYLMTGDVFEKASLIDFLNCKQISEKDFSKLSQKIKPTMGDLIFARYATIGTVCYVDIEKDFLVSYSCVTIKPNQQKIIGKYLFYFFKSNVFLEEIKRYINSNTQGNVGIDSLYRARLVVPPLFEQLQILTHIEDQTAKIDTAIELQQNYIAKLKEYKATLIDSVVTGKVRVTS